MNQFACPIVGCPHYPQGHGPKFSSLSNLIRHLKGEDHTNSHHLLNHTICNEIKLYRCTHHTCTTNPDKYFQSKRALDDHNATHHTVPTPPLHHTEDNDTTITPMSYTDIIFNHPGSETMINKWTHGLRFISENYNTHRPHFRSTWRRFLKRNNKLKFYHTLSQIITAIVHSNTTGNSEPFWWLLLHFEMLILAPTPHHARGNKTIKQIINERLKDFQQGDISKLLNDTTFNTNWNPSSPRPTSRIGNNAAQMAADADNYRTAIARACTDNKIAIINDDNISIVKKLYPSPQQHIETNHIPPTNTHDLFLPGNICDTIRRSSKNKGTGILSDSIDNFIHLANQDVETTNNNLQHIFNLVYQGKIPPRARHFFTDTYLFCIHKDEHDNRKLRPIGIPTAIRRIIATHVAQTWKDKFALHLLPYNFAVGIPNGMDFIVKSMQLSIERFIEQPQQHNTTPTRAAVFVDLTNMFNSVSRAELFDIIATDFPELYNLTKLLYEDHGTVHYKWNQTKWKHIDMKDGVNQGCPLSPIFATLVLHRVLKPLALQLEQRAAERLRQGNPGDDGYGSLAHLFAYMDDISSTVPHEDVEFFCTEIERLGSTRGCFVNPLKTRILTSCSGESILPKLDQQTAETIERTIARFSIQQNKDDSYSPVELTSGFRLLGTPVGSQAFAQEFYEEQIDTVTTSLMSMMQAIRDTQTQLKLFTQCMSQKLPHLLDSDIMHNYPTDNDSDFKQWYNWTGPLTSGIDNITSTFFRALLELAPNEQLPPLSNLISRLNVNKGGLGIINPSLRAAPDFVINMASGIRRATMGFTINKDILPIKLHPSINILYSLQENPSSNCLLRYDGLVKHIAPLCCSPTCPTEDHIIAFETRLSPKSARDYLKIATGAIMTNQIYSEAIESNNEHTHLIPSILSPQTSYPLVGMCRSKQQHRLPNWMTDLAIKRKLRLPIYDRNNPPICKCGTKHDIYGDHAFKCLRISKTQAHHTIRDSWATALQPALATAGYIRPSSKIDTERQHLLTRDISAQPFDISFDPDPILSETTNTHCPYTTIGADITIGNNCKPLPSTSSPLDVNSITAHADSHLREFERKKLRRKNKHNRSDPSESILGEQSIGDLIENNMILLPFVIDPHGRLGPILRNFLIPSPTPLSYNFQQHLPNAQIMAYKATHEPCPIGILQTADAIWKQNKTRTFYGYSYTAPTPSIYTIQQLGLGITKGFATLLRNATKLSRQQSAQTLSRTDTQLQNINST